MKTATIYEHRDKLYVHGNSRTTAGVWLLSMPVLVVAKEQVGEVGRAIRECLAASRDGILHPTSFTNLFDPVIALAGVKSYGTFAKWAKCVEVETTGDAAVTLIPTRNEGVRGGFSPLRDKTVATLSSDEALGSAAVLAIAASE
jgi:hypothetical protein